MAFTDIAIGTDGDLLIEAGRLSLVAGRRAIAQRILQRFQVFRGEWFLDLSAGVPYRQQILVKNPDLPVIDVLIRQTITGTPGVLGLQRFLTTFDRSQRSLTVQFTAETSEGEITAAVGLGTLAPEFILLLE